MILFFLIFLSRNIGFNELKIGLFDIFFERFLLVGKFDIMNENNFLVCYK